MDSAPSKPAKKTEIFKALPEVWQLIRPRRALLALGLGLMIINRVSGLVLPASTKYLVDDVIGKRHFKLLYPLVGVVLLATIIQGLTSFALTQTLSKAAQKLIAELRRRVQEHVGRLSVCILRRQQDRHAGFAHHERRRGSTQSHRHRTGGLRRRVAHRSHRLRRS